MNRYKKEGYILNGGFHKVTFVIKKNGRFYTGHSYSTGFGNSFSWSKDIGKARVMPMYLAKNIWGGCKGKILDKRKL